MTDDPFEIPDIQSIIARLHEEFYKEHPDAIILNVEFKEVDGEIKYFIDAIEPKSDDGS